MRSAILLVLASISIAGAQTPMFQVLDNPVPFGAGPVDAIGDLDGDGDEDLLSKNGVFVNDGHARFAPAPVVSLAFPRLQTVIADLDGDGLGDVASIDAANAVRLDLNLGGGLYAGPIPGLPPVVGAAATNLAAGDVDGDSDVDLLIGNWTVAGGYQVPGTPILWLNDGTAGFSPAPAGSFPALALATDRIFLRDLDQDGDLDAVLAGVPSGIAIASNANGIFTIGPPIWTGQPPSAVELGELNGDGRPDLVLSAGVVGGYGTVVILSAPSGFLPPVTTVSPPTSFPGIAIVALDLDGDGLDEILQQSVFGGVFARPVLAGGTVGPATQSWLDLIMIQAPGDASARDLDQDGDRDLVVSTGAEPVALMNGGTGALVRVDGRASAVPIRDRPFAAQIDGDGDLDIVGLGFGSPGTAIVTGLNDGDGRFVAGPSSTFPLVPALYSIHPFDQNGDGDDDFFASRNSVVPVGTGPPDFVFMNFQGSFIQLTTLASPGDTSSIQAADFDGDGDDDLLLARRGSTANGTATGITAPMLCVLNTSPYGYFASPVPIGGNHATYDLDLGDFDGNGMIDVFQTNANILGSPPDPCVLYLNFFPGYIPVPQPGLSGFFTAAGDLDGDAIADLVIDGQVWFSSPTAFFTPGPTLPVPLGAPATLADVDLDGDLDLIETPGTVLLNAGSANFGPPQSYLPPAPVAPTSLGVPETVVFDVDRDGDVDLVAPGPVVLVNTLRQIAQGSIPRPGRPASADLFGTPTGALFLFGSNGTGSFPFPPWGTVLIDPASAQLGAVGLFNGPASPLPGTASFGLTLPNNPALVGWTTYWQAIEATQMRFTNRLTVTVMGY